MPAVTLRVFDALSGSTVSARGRIRFQSEDGQSSIPVEIDGGELDLTSALPPIGVTLAVEDYLERQLMPASLDDQPTIHVHPSARVLVQHQDELGRSIDSDAGELLLSDAPPATGELGCDEWCSPFHRGVDQRVRGASAGSTQSFGPLPSGWRVRLGLPSLTGGVSVQYPSGELGADPVTDGVHHGPFRSPPVPLRGSSSTTFVVTHHRAQGLRGSVDVARLTDGLELPLFVQAFALGTEEETVVVRSFDLEGTSEVRTDGTFEILGLESGPKEVVCMPRSRSAGQHRLEFLRAEAVVPEGDVVDIGTMTPVGQTDVEIVVDLPEGVHWPDVFHGSAAPDATVVLSGFGADDVGPPWFGERIELPLSIPTVLSGLWAGRWNASFVGLDPRARLAPEWQMGPRPLEQTIQVPTESRIRLELPVHRPVLVEVVLEGLGEPVARALAVAYRPEVPERPRTLELGAPDDSDPEGRRLIGECEMPSGEWVFLVFSEQGSKGGSYFARGSTTIHAGPGPSRVELGAEPGVRILGRVDRGTGRSTVQRILFFEVEGVSGWGDGEVIVFRPEVDAEGNFVIDGVPPGAVLTCEGLLLDPLRATGGSDLQVVRARTIGG